jgi:HD-GYP domain-containing protein (c-di-GMP phosphodiesterase class II)
MIGRCLREGHTVVTGEASAEPDRLVTDADADCRSEVVVPVRVGERLWGALKAEELAPDAFGEVEIEALEGAAAVLGAALAAAELYERLDRAYLGTAEALATALEAKDAYTADHCRSLVRNAEVVARLLEMPESDLYDLRYAAALHDIGKIAVSRETLNKAGPLTDEEQAAIEQHPVVGERILAPIEFLRGALPIVRHAHERWDGRGYPDGLAGEEIPLGARVLLACDAYDAMTKDRPYRAALGEAEARTELRRGAGSQFDPRVVDALLGALAAPRDRRR